MNTDQKEEIEISQEAQFSYSNHITQEILQFKEKVIDLKYLNNTDLSNQIVGYLSEFGTLVYQDQVKVLDTGRFVIIKYGNLDNLIFDKKGEKSCLFRNSNNKLYFYNKTTGLFINEDTPNQLSFYNPNLVSSDFIHLFLEINRKDDKYYIGNKGYYINGLQIFDSSNEQIANINNIQICEKVGSRFSGLYINCTLKDGTVVKIEL